MWIEKTRGCDEMYCVCGKAFCYCCGEKECRFIPRCLSCGGPEYYCHCADEAWVAWEETKALAEEADVDFWSLRDAAKDQQGGKVSMRWKGNPRHRPRLDMKQQRERRKHQRKEKKMRRVRCRREATSF